MFVRPVPATALPATSLVPARSCRWGDWLRLVRSLPPSAVPFPAAPGPIGFVWRNGLERRSCRCRRRPAPSLSASANWLCLTRASPFVLLAVFSSIYAPLRRTFDEDAGWAVHGETLSSRGLLSVLCYSVTLLSYGVVHSSSSRIFAKLTSRCGRHTVSDSLGRVSPRRNARVNMASQGVNRSAGSPQSGKRNPPTPSISGFHARPLSRRVGRASPLA